MEEEAPKVETFLNETLHKVEDKIVHFYNETKPGEINKLSDMYINTYILSMLKVGGYLCTCIFCNTVLHHVETEVVTVIENGEDFVKKESEVVGGAMKSSVTWVKDTFHFLKYDL